MGYRLDIYNCFDEKGNQISVRLCGTKLYGYTDETLKSAEFLVNKGYWKGEYDESEEDYAEVLSTCAWLNPTIKISVEDFREFAKLYNGELNNQIEAGIWKGEPNWWINQQGIQEILKMPNNYQVELDWG